MKIRFEMSANECNVATNEILNTTATIGIGDAADQKESIRYMRNSFRSGKVENFPGGNVTGSYSPETEAYAMDISIEEDAVTMAIAAAAKVMIAVWPMVAPFVTFAKTWKSQVATLKTIIKEAVKPLMDRYHVEPRFGVTRITVDELNLDELVVLEDDQLGNGRDSVNSRHLYQINSKGDCKLVNEVLKQKYESGKLEVCWYEDREEAKACAEKMWEEILHINTAPDNASEEASTEKSQDAADHEVAYALILVREMYSTISTQNDQLFKLTIRDGYIRRADNVTYGLVKSDFVLASSVVETLIDRADRLALISKADLENAIAVARREILDNRKPLGEDAEGVITLYTEGFAPFEVNFLAGHDVLVRK